MEPGEQAIGLEKSLGKRIQDARKQAGMTQQQLCQKTGLSYSTLAKIERGAIKSPSIFTIQQLAGELGIGLDQLVGSSRSPAPVAAKKRSRSGVTFVYFDVNGCLVRFFHRAFNKLAEESGAQADMIETTFWHYNDAVCRGELTMDEFNNAFAERLGLANLDWLRYYLEAIDPIPEMHDLVAWAAEHYKIGLLTNIMPGFIEAMRAKGFIPNINYDQIIDSSQAGSIKPERKIYESAQEAAGCPPEEILFVDDSRTNIMAAERMGWHVLWFDDFRPQDSVQRVKHALEPAESFASA